MDSLGHDDPVMSPSKFTFFDDAIELVRGMTAASKYELDMEFLASFLKNIQLGKSVEASVQHALMEWDI